MKKITLFILCAFLSANIFAQTWNPLVTGTTTSLINISFANDITGWSVGLSGKIIATTNGGSSWTSQTSGTSVTLYSVYAIDPSNAFVVGDGSTILRTTNGGTTWTPVSAPISADLRNVFFFNSTTGFIVGAIGSTTGVVFKTTDGGATWNNLTVGSIAATYGLFFTDANTGYISAAFGGLKKTTDGGATWTSLTSGTSVLLDYLFFTDANTGYVSGENGTILKTTDAGMTWTPLSTGTSSVRFLGIKFLDPATGYASGGLVGGTNAGSIYKTMNAGATWTLEATNVNRFYRGTFPSYGAGYVCGLNGTVVKVANINSGVGIAENSAVNFDFDLFPNPFNNTVSVNIELKEEGEVSIILYDALGKVCASQDNGLLSSGKHQLTFNDLTLASGMYTLQMTVNGVTESKKLIRTE